MLRERLELGRNKNIFIQPQLQHKEKTVVVVVETKRKAPKKRKLPRPEGPGTSGFSYTKSKICFSENRLIYTQRTSEDGEERNSEEWEALEMMASIMRGNLEDALTELKNELTRLQGKLVMADYTYCLDYEEDTKKSKFEEEEEEEESSDTCGSSSSN
jgi:hypothetical protein